MPGLVPHRPLLAVMMLALIVAEFLWRRRSGRYDLRDAAASLGVALGQVALRPVTLILLLAVLAPLRKLAPLSLPVDDWRTWVAAFFAVDFTYYWFHRASHRIRWLWATHAVHHSSRQMVLPAAIRLGWTAFFSLGWLFFAALILMGFPPLIVGAMLATNLLYQFPLHSEAIGRLGPLEAMFNTPSHHRAHHSRDAPYLDCNFGGILILWDRMFGTFRAEPRDGGLRYGLADGDAGSNPFRIALGEWARLFRAMRAAGSFGGAMAVALSKPGSDSAVDAS